MSQNPINMDKFSKLLEWEQQYRREQQKAQRATTYTTSSRSHRYTDKIKFKRIKFWTKDGRIKYNTQYNIYPQAAVFGESYKIFQKIPQKRIKVRDNDEVSQSQDINHAVEKGIRKLKDQITIRKAEEMIAKTQQNRGLKKTKFILKLKK